MRTRYDPWGSTPSSRPVSGTECVTRVASRPSEIVRTGARRPGRLSSSRTRTGDRPRIRKVTRAEWP
jgi:hypothetical protein